MMRLARNIAYLAFPVLCLLSSGAKADNDTEQAFSYAAKRDWQQALYHAGQSNESAAEDIILWLAIMDGLDTVPAATIQQLMAKHSDWPERHKMQWRYETALLRENASADADLLKWFDINPPISGAGRLLKARALIASGAKPEETKQLIREAWVQGDFTPEVEQDILSSYRPCLDKKLHEARADRLVWEGQYSAARRLFPLLSTSYQQLVETRIALETGNKKAPSLLAKVPASLRHNPGLVYSRLHWRHAKNDTKGAMDMLLVAPKQNQPYPEKWWDYRQYYVRHAVDTKQYGLALKLLKGHGLKEGTDFADAVWLKGWILLEFQKNATDAYAEFDTLYRGVSYAVSKARAAYWAGRAAEKMRDEEIAKSWFKSASEYPTTFYGQLASIKLNKSSTLSLPLSDKVDQEAYQQFKQSDIARVLILCLDYQREDIASKFIHALVDKAESAKEMLYIAQLAQEHHSDYLGVKAAKRALQHNVLLKELAYPTLDYAEPDLESPLAHAIIRQESEFNPDAKSPSGALGYMQLLPGTGKEVARKLGMDTKGLRLTHSPTNMKLGSTYLARLIHGFDGSYLLGVASYNAGPANVRSWIRQFGDPGRSADAAVNWIEKIPYAETRNYVQRVLENLQVYRVILGGGEGTALMLEQDLTR